jgi:hypothetical protein
VVSWSTKRHIRTWMSIALVCLALSVLGWGTGYKLSLYHPSDDSSRQIPQAKLLSKNEQNAPTDTSLTSKIKDELQRKEMRTSLRLLFLAYVVSFAGSFLVSALSLGARAAGRHWHLCLHASLTFFFVLPPPDLA